MNHVAAIYGFLSTFDPKESFKEFEVKKSRTVNREKNIFFLFPPSLNVRKRGDLRHLTLYV